jgi:hypothetical protein
MTGKIPKIIAMSIIFALAFVVNCWLFDTPFAEVSIDWFAFLAGIFLMTEATWKIMASKKPVFPNQLLRVFRAIIGMNVFTIHLLQFMRY